VKLPNLDEAYAPEEKVRDYLLNVEHENGRGKALFFMRFGFSIDNWEALAQAIISHAHEHEVVKAVTTRFGVRYVIEGVLQTPSRRTPQVRAVWFIPVDDYRPRLTTAYPLEERNDD
jgi:hypothetical protein